MQTDEVWSFVGQRKKRKRWLFYAYAPVSSLHYGLSAVGMVEKLYESIIPRYHGKEMEIQILSPMTKGSLGTANLNKMVQERINPEREGKAQILIGGRSLREGGRVIQKRNNYDLNVFNGDIGTIIQVDNEEMELSVSFRAGKEVKEVKYTKEHLLGLDLAYAITIHKLQGSEFESVIIPVVTQQFGMLFRNLFYTGITRAKKLAVFEYLERARQNIEKFRKGNASITFVDAKKKPVKGAKVEINQITQDFIFGNLSEEVLRPDLSREDSIRFTHRFKELFNFTELTVKWAPYEWEQGKPQWEKLQEKLNWCMQNGITPKGHTLGWINMAGTPPWVLALPAERATELYKARIYNLVGGFKDKIKMWDVVNEPVTTVPW